MKMYMVQIFHTEETALALEGDVGDVTSRELV